MYLRGYLRTYLYTYTYCTVCVLNLFSFPPIITVCRTEEWPKSKSDLRKSPKSLFTVPSRSVDDIVLAPPPRGPWATFRPRREHIPVQRSFPTRRGACRDQGGANRARAGAERSRKSISRSTENPFPFTRDENRFQFLATSVLQTVISPIFWCLADWSEAPV